MAAYDNFTYLYGDVNLYTTMVDPKIYDQTHCGPAAERQRQVLA